MSLLSLFKLDISFGQILLDMTKTSFVPKSEAPTTILNKLHSGFEGPITRTRGPHISNDIGALILSDPHYLKSEKLGVTFKPLNVESVQNNGTMVQIGHMVVPDRSLGKFLTPNRISQKAFNYLKNSTITLPINTPSNGRTNITQIPKITPV